MKNIFAYILIILILFSCNEKNNNKNDLLTRKISEIEKMQYFEYFVTLFSDSVQAKFYNRENPELIYHPYRYLRDTVKITELLKFTNTGNPFVKLYSFSALEKRNYQDLFSIVMKHLDDTTKFYVQSNDHGWNSTTIDMMLHYSQDKFTTVQKDSLRHLILTRHDNIGTLDEILLFFKPDSSYYLGIKKIAYQEQSVFSLIALSTYQKQDDISIIQRGFDKINYYSGTYIFFKAIENFADNEFLTGLIEYGENIKGNSSVMDDYIYYYYALAKYRNQETFKILSEMTDRKYYSSDAYWHSNIIHIYKALKKYEYKKYKKLMNDILETLYNVGEKDIVYKLNMSKLNSDSFLNNNAWNY